MTRPTTQRERDLASGGHTGWWDETGQPAPFPNDFFDSDTDWRPETTPPPDSPRRTTLLTPNRRISRCTTPRGLTIPCQDSPVVSGERDRSRIGQ